METKKDEVQGLSNDPEVLEGNYSVNNVAVDGSFVLKRGELIDYKKLNALTSLLESGQEVLYSNQCRPGTEIHGTSELVFMVDVMLFDSKRSKKKVLVYATTAANALACATDYFEKFKRNFAFMACRVLDKFQILPNVEDVAGRPTYWLKFEVTGKNVNIIAPGHDIDEARQSALELWGKNDDEVFELDGNAIVMVSVKKIKYDILISKEFSDVYNV